MLFIYSQKKHHIDSYIVACPVRKWQKPLANDIPRSYSSQLYSALLVLILAHTLPLLL
jgi:hypothetical protein